MYTQHNTEVRSLNYCCHGKTVSVTYPLCVCVCVALVIQHVSSMRRITLSPLVCLVSSYFGTLSHKRHDLLKKVVKHKICVLILSTTFI